MFGLFRKKSGPAPAAEPQETVLTVAPEADFSDLTTAAACDRAVAEGRLEPFLMIGAQFGGEPTGPNLLLGPRGAAAAKARIDDAIVAAIEAGQSVNLDSTIDYAGESRVPRAVCYDLGAVGTYILRFGR